MFGEKGVIPQFNAREIVDSKRKEKAARQRETDNRGIGVPQRAQGADPKGEREQSEIAFTLGN